MKKPDRMPAGVVLSSLAVANPLTAMEKAAEMGFTAVEITPPEPRWAEAEGAAALAVRARRLKFNVCAVSPAFPGENRRNRDVYAATVGLIPAKTRGARLEAVRQAAALGRPLGTRVLAVSLGTLPSPKNRVAWRGALETACAAADICRAAGLSLAIETGPEAPDTLAAFLTETRRRDVGVWFDPGELVRFGSAEPVEALRVLRKWILGVQWKDALWPLAAGDIGEETLHGRGAVGLRRFVAALGEIGWKGPVLIERESGIDRILDLLNAKAVFERTKQELL
ncbi:MAG: TIM barrel protein [Planctomycetota bacterium]